MGAYARVGGLVGGVGAGGLAAGDLAHGEDTLGVDGHVRVGGLDRGVGALDGHDARRPDRRLLGHVDRHERHAAEHEHEEQREEEEACKGGKRDLIS